jgi:ribosomal protein RSM22 (predicted rRNA methylase)
MDPRALVRPLEAGWEDVLSAVLAPMQRPSLSMKDVARLAPKVAELSRAYNSGQAEGTRKALPLEARIAFSFPRDVPKGAGAVRELVASGALRVPGGADGLDGRPLRVVDLGAGLGAMTWGLVRALTAAGGTGRVEALLIDEDAAALQKAQAIAQAARAAFGAQLVELAIETRVQNVAALSSSMPAKADVVLVGQLLSEMAPRASEEERLAHHAELLERLLRDVVAPDGSLVVIEPALRDRTRHLHAVRDRILEAGRGASVFAPCLHAARCPVLTTEDGWCHEDMPVDLPTWLAPLARAAGLRWQGLTFSYLVLRTDGRALGVPASVAHAERASFVRFRAVSELLPSKGKAELWTCGADGTRLRLRRLERDMGEEDGVPFGELLRGDIVTLSTPPHGAGSGPGSGRGPGPGPVDDRGRIEPHVAIDVGGFGQ